MKLPYVITVVFVFLTFGIQAQEISWMSWEEAIERSTTDSKPKKIFVDVYTDWCGWCKKMDATTFSDPEVAAYMNENFYMVKFDAESREAVEYKEKVFTFQAQGKRGFHELAYALLQGRLSYPSEVFMNEKQELLSPVPGYREADEFLQIARYFGDDIFLHTKWADYQAKGSGK
ncbi:thioredoxin family protein [Robertkochia flava]|uniref:thioredoxin family protein n=1 Tax=Robertkochia flava TaxID=3447986 RepID=UPI001CCA816E|nr:DUF255 domain-containing protein [Robertkochia marina]